MDYHFYKITHFVGIFLTFSALGGLVASVRLAPGKKNSMRRAFSALHGIGLLVVLVAGFGLLGKAPDVEGFPPWAMVKMGVWLALGAASALIVRMPKIALVTLLGSVALGGVGAWLALAKPF